MPDSFGNSVLGVALALVVAWAWLAPEEAGNWINKFQHGRTGSVVTE